MAPAVKSKPKQHAQKAAVYCRISRDPSGQELGVRRQEDDCRALCEREGYELVQLFVDDDRSAYTGKPRPQFEAMKQRIREGGIDVVVAWHPDRLTRHPRELEDLIDLLETTATTVRTVQTGQYDLGTPAGRMAARIVGAVARHESEHKSARLRRKHLELAEAGKLSGGGTRPFGYDDDRLTVRKGEAKVIRSMADRILAGDSVRSVCTWLNTNDVRTPTGIPWKPIGVRRVLTSPRIAGLRGHRGAIAAHARWGAIIDADDHRRLVAVLKDPARRTNQGGRPRKLLTGLVRCGRCGGVMVSRPRADKQPTYICVGPRDMSTGCGSMRILGEPLNELVTAAALHRLDSPAMTAALAPLDDDEATLKELRGVESRREELAAMWAAGEVSRAEWSAASTALDKRQAVLEAELRQHATPAPVTDVDDIVERWPSLSHDRRRAVLAALIESVEIGSAVRGRNWFDAGRVSVQWRA